MKDQAREAVLSLFRLIERLSRGANPLGGDVPARAAPQRGQMSHGVRHQAFAARLVDGTAPTVDDLDLQTRSGGANGGGQPGGPAAGDDEVDHANLARAEFSARMRACISAALSTVNAAAVIHAECTSGSARPSAATAT